MSNKNIIICLALAIIAIIAGGITLNLLGQDYAAKSSFLQCWGALVMAIVVKFSEGK